MANFIGVRFDSETDFSHVVFKDQENVLFDVESLSKVSFLGVDITRVRFSERVEWGEVANKFKILDERRLEQCVHPLFSWNKISEKEHEKIKRFFEAKLNLEWVHSSKIEKHSDNNVLTITSIDGNNMLSILLMEREKIAVVKVGDKTKYAFSVKHLDGELKLYTYTGIRPHDVMAIYRYLRENYEYRLRYEEAGDLFVREMELKRKYEEIRDGNAFEVKEKKRFARNISPIGIYYNLCRYGENYKFPSVFALVAIMLSTTYLSVKNYPADLPSTTFVGLNIIATSLLKSIKLFFPLDDVVDWQGLIMRLFGSLMLALIFISLRRKFERRFRH